VNEKQSLMGEGTLHIGASVAMAPITPHTLRIALCVIPIHRREAIDCGEDKRGLGDTPTPSAGECPCAPYCGGKTRGAGKMGTPRAQRAPAGGVRPCALGI
jgi:hypothetical protein